MNTTALSLRHAEEVVVLPVNGANFFDPEAPQLEEARLSLLERLRTEPQGTVTPLSLTDVELSASCLAVLLGPVLLKITRGEFPGRYLLGVDANGKNEWDADAALKKESARLGEKLVCVWQGQGSGVKLVGEVDRQVEATYEYVLRRGLEGTTARDVAKHFRLSIQASSNRLAKTAALGLIHRAERRPLSGSGGAELVFIPVR